MRLHVYFLGSNNKRQGYKNIISYLLREIIFKVIVITNTTQTFSLRKKNFEGVNTIFQVFYSFEIVEQVFLGLNAAKHSDYTKNISNKSCLEFYFLQKSQQACVSISHKGGAGASNICHFPSLVTLKSQNKTVVDLKSPLTTLLREIETCAH